MPPSARTSATPDMSAAKRVNRTVCPAAPANAPDGTPTGAPCQRSCTSSRSSAAPNGAHSRNSPRTTQRMGGK